MKKLILAFLLAASATVATAQVANVSLLGGQDVAKTQGVFRLEAQATDKYKVYGVTPIVNFTSLNDKYSRVGVGGTYKLTTLGPVQTYVYGTGVYQDTKNSSVSGYGLTAGVKAVYSLNKNVDVVGILERFQGQDRVSAFNGQTVMGGFSYKF